MITSQQEKGVEHCSNPLVNRFMSCFYNYGGHGSSFLFDKCSTTWQKINVWQGGKVTQAQVFFL